MTHTGVTPGDYRGKKGYVILIKVIIKILPYLLLLSPVFSLCLLFVTQNNFEDFYGPFY